MDIELEKYPLQCIDDFFYPSQVLKGLASNYCTESLELQNIAEIFQPDAPLSPY